MLICLLLLDLFFFFIFFLCCIFYLLLLAFSLLLWFSFSIPAGRAAALLCALKCLTNLRWRYKRYELKTLPCVADFTAGRQAQLKIGIHGDADTTTPDFVVLWRPVLTGTGADDLNTELFRVQCLQQLP